VSTSFATRVLRWYRQQGRHDLPWQKSRTLYRVWVAEIMLQQTQVKTVIPYYQRFMRTFPGLKQLAEASLDAVLAQWAGLGYYTRARNLHRSAQLIQSKHRGRFPRDFDALLALPGIGRSTAAAILSQALDERHVILDGNVKRVLSRYHAIDGWPGLPAVTQQLWQLAAEVTPNKHNADYTQAIMDLGATLCTRSRPGCAQCPLACDCAALAEGRVAALPAAKPRKPLPVKTTRMLVLTNAAGAVLLEKRPPSGIWGGLWSLPEVAMEQDIAEVCQQRWGLRVKSRTERPGFRHTFSHYHLDIQPSQCAIESSGNLIGESSQLKWCQPGDKLPAVATPVAKLLNDLTQSGVAD
jgi:A/G-specific adenine glycosylase